MSFIRQGQTARPKASKPRVGTWSLSRWVAATCVFLSSAPVSTLLAQAGPSNGGPVPVPAARVNLSVVGYQGLSRMARLTDEFGVSLNFVDRDHVLIATTSLTGL